MTGGAVHATDPTNASRTLLFDLRRRRWDPSLAALFGVPEAVLPECVPRPAISGPPATFPDFPTASIAGIAGDQQAALFGQGCVARGGLKNTYGTGCFLMLHTGGRPMNSRSRLLTTAACGPRGEPAYALEGSVFVAGAAIVLRRDGLGVIGIATVRGSLASVRTP